jgi:AcrR family transcriptional regulator
MKRGRPSRLSRDAILDVAQELDEKELSFARVAEILGVAPTSIYHYFTSLGQLRTFVAERLIREVEFLDNHPSGDFCSYLLRFLLDYKDWLEELSLHPSVFELDYGGLRFKNHAPPHPLFVRFEDFLQTADQEGIDLRTAVHIWFIVADFMTRSLSVSLPDQYLLGVHNEMKIFLKDRTSEEFPLTRSYLDKNSDVSVPSRDLYETAARVLVKGLAEEFDLSRNR